MIFLTVVVVYNLRFFMEKITGDKGIWSNVY